jgi:Hint domain-containing protein
MTTNRPTPQRGTVSELITKLLDKGYDSAAQPTLNAVARSTNSGLIQQRLAELEAEAQRLADAGERLMPDNPILRALLADLDDTLQRDSRLIDGAAEPVQTSGIDAAGNIQRQLALPGMTNQQLRAIGIRWNVPDPEAVNRLVQYSQSPNWAALMNSYSPDVLGVVNNQAIRGIALGFSPLHTTREIRRITENLPAHVANNQLRTLQLTSFRDGTSIHQTANRDITSQVIRIATRDERTCFLAGTMIATSEGLKPIESIQVGDKVLTDEGRFRRVAATMKRPYRGKVMVLRTNETVIQATANHPILIERGENRNWIPAEDCKIGDGVFISPENILNDCNHVRSHFTIERHIGNTNDNKSSSYKPLVLSLIGIRAFMPVDSVNFQRNIEASEIKINWITIYTSFLFKWFLKCLKAKPDIPFGFSLPCVASVTTWGTKFLMNATRTYSELLFAGQTRLNNSRATAFLRTMKFLISMHCKQLAAALTNSFPNINISARETANLIAIHISSPDSKFFIANGANLCDSSRFMPTFGATIARIPFGNFRRTQLEISTTDLASKSNSLPLILSSASIATISRIDLCRTKIECFTADDTTFFRHSTIISRAAIQMQCDVYNLEVEEDHTYIANGIVVHNCLSCIAQHGDVIWDSETDADSPVPRVNDHQSGRCTSVVRVKGRPPLPIQSGEDWFNSLSPERQAQQRSFVDSPGKFSAYSTGKVTLRDFIHPYTDPVFNDMVREASLTDALKPK